MITAPKRGLFTTGFEQRPQWSGDLPAQPAGRFSPSKRVINTAVRERPIAAKARRVADRVDWWIALCMDWTDDALAALKKDVPFFVRPAVRRRVESMAVEDNRDSIDLVFYQQAKASMGPK